MGLACDICNAVCCKNALITITSFDMLRIRDNTGKMPEEFCCLYEPKMIRVNWNTVIETKQGLYVLAIKSRPCIFLNGKTCSIFNFAPLSCKIYPHNFEKNISSFALCNSISKVIFKINNPGFSYIEQFREEYEKYIDIVRKTSALKLDRENVIKHLENETEKIIHNNKK
ncbi:MAG: YkgJ family cysteine cluster protein [Candidatus Anstonellales archaeon]